MKANDSQAGSPNLGRRCPVCDAPLISTRVKAVAVDACDAHGIWLDHGELDRILARRVRTMNAGKKTALAQARKDGKVLGALFGWWSLLFK